MRAAVLRVFLCVAASVVILAAGPATAQPLQKFAIQVNADGTKQVGDIFSYRLVYSCSNTSNPCVGAEVVDLLPAEVQIVSGAGGTVPSAPQGDVTAIQVTPNYMGTGRTQVRFQLINPLPAGKSGDLIINVRFPNGTPNGTVATNTADGINLGATPGTFTTPSVSVTAVAPVATVQVDLRKTLLTLPAQLNTPETYWLRISVPSGALSLTSIGPVTDTLPPGTVFNGATPAADCQPGCVGTTPSTLTWASPCTVPLQPNGSCGITVDVTFPGTTFSLGDMVTNSFNVEATPMGGPPQIFGPKSYTLTITTSTPNPNATLTKGLIGGSSAIPLLNQTFSYFLGITNTGNVPLDNLVIIDTLPVEMQVTSVTTGSYTNLDPFAEGEGVRVSYEKNTASGFILWGSSSDVAMNRTLSAPPPGLGAGEYITRIRWEFGKAEPSMNDVARPQITGRIVNPDNAGGTVAVGDTIQNCADVTAVYTAGSIPVSRRACESFNVSDAFVELHPEKGKLGTVNLFSPGDSVSYRLRVRSFGVSNSPVPLETLVATDLLPVNLIFGSWSYDAQSTGLPAPQVVEQIPNFAGTGRTLLRWRWNAGSGNLGIGQQVWINITTTIRSGTPSGSLNNDFTLETDSPILSQRCFGSSQADSLDYDGDGDTAELLCRESEAITIQGVAQLSSEKTLQGICDGGFGATSAGTLTGGAIQYRLYVQNTGTVPMQNIVLIDILPHMGDVGVRDINPRGSMWTPLLAAPITPPAGTVIYYSTSGNPCRGEVGGPTTSCDPPNWTTVPPDPITSVRSFKVEFGSRVLQPFDFLEFNFSMVTPGDVPAGQPTYNSFAYQADRADGLGSLAAEPQKVGISLGNCAAASLGDFVWADANLNGVQDDGPTGLNNVDVQLYRSGVDGIPDTKDDIPLFSVITGNGPGSAPGWYSFPGLAPGNYHVCIVRPPTFEFTLLNQGADTADSDAASRCSPVVTLTADENNPTIDFGLVATRLAALGNYVWFDRNGDGIQNESPFDGANGVTVRLYVDDGDGNPEPGAGDVLVATTVTADDVYGQPGYYLFDGLIPGIRYFVQFVRPASATAFTTQNAGADDTVDSDATPADGTTQTVILAPDEVNRTLDAGLVSPTGTMALGDQVWMESDNDGLFEPQNGEMGVNGVRLNLYLDANGDGQPTLDEYIATTTTSTAGGFDGRYRFANLAPGTYIVVVAPQSFQGGGALFGKITSTGNDPAPDPDNDANDDDNGTDVGALTASRAVTLTDNGEPISEDGNNDTNLTVDFGFIPAGVAPVPEYDYGDAPDVAVGTLQGDYNTTALDTGAVHLVGVTGAPYLGACVDADGGFNQDPAASQDDAISFGTVAGTCAGGDDEDGVTFTGPFEPGSTASFSVTAGNAACSLDAWVDWNRDGDFADAGEQIASSMNVPTGAPTVLTPAVPAGAVPGLTYARFRCSTVGGLTPIGPAADGEVEDYAAGVAGTDFGDAPASYGTQGAGAASHIVDPLATLLLGTCVDTETDGQPDVLATGDDNTAGTSRVGNCFDDEDGVAFTSVLTVCQTANVTVTTSAAGVLNAWIDFNLDGDFGDAGEQIFSGQAVSAGANPLSFNVPCTALQGATYSRFRLTSEGDPGPTGAADDGEVEDYAVNLGAVDFGDAPDTYGTLLASGGPNHRVVTGFSLGATIDSETAGQPSVGADGDGADEDGVVLPNAAMLTACSTANISVTLTNTAGIATPRLDAWIDFDGDGVFSDPRDRIATGLALTAGVNVVPVNVPCDAQSAASYARFRLSSTGVANPGGAATDGEVEDYAFLSKGLDFGDAADPSYPTLLASNGARHVVLPAGNPTLGATVDTEPNGQPDAALLGDDTNGDDENGVTFPAILVPGLNGTIQLSTGATGGTVSCWIDFNQNGSWGDAGEQVVTDVAIAASTVTAPTFPVPAGSPQGTAAARCRISSQTGLGVTGEAPDGEVEDHPVTVGVEMPEIGIGKRLVSLEKDPSQPQTYLVTYSIRLENMGNVPLSGVNATAAFSTVFTAPASYTLVSLTSPTLAVNPGFNGQGDVNLLTPGNTLGVGGSGEIQVVLRLVSGGKRGPYVCSSTATGDTPGGVTVTDISQDGGDPDPNDDGDASDNNDPTVFELPAEVTEIPTVGEWGLILLAMLLGWVALRRMRMAGA